MASKIGMCYTKNYAERTDYISKCLIQKYNLGGSEKWREQMYGPHIIRIRLLS